MTLPSEVLRSQARFEREALKRGRALTLAYAGPWTRSPATGAVSRTVTTGQARGFVDFGKVSSDLVREQVDKWGRSFTPDGYALLPMPTPVDGLAALTDGSPRGEVYDVLDALPDAFAQDRCHTLLLRRRPVYNRLVQVRVEDNVERANGLLMLNLPCRLTPVEAMLEEAEGLGQAEAATLILECPFVLAGAGALGSGVLDAGAAGAVVFIAPKESVITDDPAAYGRSGPALRYRVSSVGQDVGGDLHHLKYLVTKA